MTMRAETMWRGMRVATAGALLCVLTQQAAAQPAIAPTGTLRAAYIVTNLAQAAKDPATGEIKGASADVARELGRRFNVPVAIMPVASAAAVLDAVAGGSADIGFVAPNPERTGVVLYSQTYMLVQQSFVVKGDGPIKSIADLDKPGQTVGANTNDSVAVYLKTWLKQAKLRESPDFTIKEGEAWLADGTVVAFGGNRQRLAASTRGMPNIRMLADNLYGVPQTVAVANGRTEVLAAVNAAIDEMRGSGFLQAAMDRSGVDGITVAPAEKR